MNRKTLILTLAGASLGLAGVISPTLAQEEKSTSARRVERMIKRFDANADQKVSLDEMKTRAEAAFKGFDADANGEVTQEEIKTKRAAFQAARKQWRETKSPTEAEKTEAKKKLRQMRPGAFPGMQPEAFEKADLDKSGSLNLTEASQFAGEMFKRRDTNGDGFIDVADLAKKI